MQKLAGITLNEWDPNSKYGDYLIDKEDLMDEKTIKQFVHLYNLNPQIIDIWKYAKSNFKKYPDKILPKGMVYTTPSSKLEFEFNGNDKINMWVFDKWGEGIKSAAPFTFKNFNKFLTN